MCVINRECKILPIHNYYKQFGDYDIVQYVGIAHDEPKRLARLKGNQVSLLEKYSYTESMAKEKCSEYDLLSPIYVGGGQRGGCWFCPNARIKSLADFRNKHPELWEELIKLSRTPNLCSYGFKYGMTVQEVTERMDALDAQLKLF